MSNKTPPQSEHVNPIKEDLNELIRNNEFKKEKKLQKKLKVNWENIDLDTALFLKTGQIMRMEC